MQLKSIAQQVVVVVGASSGIGRETALQFAKRGAKVVAIARSQPGLDSLVAEIGQMGGDAIAIAADTSNFEQVKGVVDKAIAHYGRIDTWVQNAAVEIYASFDDTTVDEFRRVMEVNYLGHVYALKAVLPHLKRTGGALIHVTSVEAVRSLPLQSAYAASKHAVNGLLEAVRVELMHDQAPVSITEIQPAGINTPLFDKAITRLGMKPQGTPSLYSPGAVAEAILYAAEHPTRSIVVGDAGKMVVLAQRLAPQLLDAYLVRSGFESQKTNQPKSADAPNNLYVPIAGFDRSEGDLQDKTQPSLLTKLDTNPPLRWGAIAAAGIAILVMLSEVLD